MATTFNLLEKVPSNPTQLDDYFPIFFIEKPQPRMYKNSHYLLGTTETENYQPRLAAS